MKRAKSEREMTAATGNSQEGVGQPVNIPGGRSGQAGGAVLSSAYEAHDDILPLKFKKQ